MGRRLPAGNADFAADPVFGMGLGSGMGFRRLPTETGRLFRLWHAAMMGYLGQHAKGHGQVQQQKQQEQPSQHTILEKFFSQPKTACPCCFHPT